MNAKTASAIAVADDEQAKEVAARLSRLLHAAVAAGCDDDLFLRHRSVALSVLRAASHDIEPLQLAGLIALDAGAVVSNVMLHSNPHKGLVDLPQITDQILVATDWPDLPPQPNAFFDGREMVFPLHFESLAVLLELSRLKGARDPKRCLDIFCGSGVFGIYAFKLGVRSIVFADKFPRSLAFAKLNAALNGLDDAQFFLSDYFSGLSATQKCDLILANPPFEAIPEQDKEHYFYHSYGGSTGQEAMDRFLRDIPEYLASDGTALAVNFLLSDQTGLATRPRLARYLGAQLDPSMSARVSVFDQMPVKDFWLRYDDLGIDRDHNLRDGLLKEGLTFILLCTVQVEFRSSGATSSALRSIKFEYPPGTLWCNPLSWPLPCGVGIAPVARELWFLRWLDHESETRCEQVSILAEAMGNPEDKVDYWDFLPALLETEPTYVHDAHKLLRSALLATVMDARYLSLADAALPSGVSVFLLPNDRNADKLCFEICCPPQAEQDTSRGTFFRQNRDRFNRQHTMADMEKRFIRYARDPHNILFLFTIRHPPRTIAEQVKQPTLLGDIYDYKHLALGELVWKSKHYEPPDFSGNTLRDDFLSLQPGQVQRYALLFRVGNGSISSLESLELVLGINWKRRVHDQCFRFMRDRMTLLVAPIMLARRTEEIARLEEENEKKGMFMAYSAHTVAGPSADALNFLSLAQQGYEPQTNVQRAKARIVRLQRNAQTVLSVLRANSKSKGDVEIYKILTGVLDEIAEDRALPGNPPLHTKYEMESFVFSATNPQLLEVLLITLVRNAVEHIDQSAKRGMDINQCPLMLRAADRCTTVLVEVENGGEEVPDAEIQQLNDVGDTLQAWPVTRKGASHYAIGIRKAKWAASKVNGELMFQKRQGRFVASLVIRK